MNAAQRAKVRRLSAPKQGEEAGELNVVPFLDIIMNVMMFVLATVAIAFTSTADVSPPRHLPTRPDPSPRSLGLSVFVVDDGFSIKASGGNVAPGCADTGAGLAIGKVDGHHDFTGLQKCAAKLKASSPNFASESSVTISANPAIRYETVIATMDAVRQTNEGADLFPDVSFGVVR